MKERRKMVLISKHEYAQLRARTKPTEDVTESSHIESTKHKLTQSGLGLTKIKPQGPHGIPVKKQQKKFSNGLPLGWMDF